MGWLLRKETSIEDDIMAAIETADEPIAEDDADLHNGGAVASEPVQDDSEQHTDEAEERFL
jgi:hypothetical protein